MTRIRFAAILAYAAFALAPEVVPGADCAEGIVRDARAGEAGDRVGSSQDVRGAAITAAGISDVNDKTARLLLLTAGGPLVVEFTMTIDGQPFRLPRERFVDDMLQQADTDGDGIGTWREALGNPRFSCAIFGPRPLEPSHFEGFAKKFDLNGDRLIDRTELRASLGPPPRGDAFMLSPYRYNVSSHPDLMPVLDADGDGLLSAGEIRDAPERLRRLDGNGNELLERDEIRVAGAAPAARDGDGAAGRRIVANRTGVFDLGADPELREVYESLKSRYVGGDDVLRAEDLPLALTPIASLDANGDGNIDRVELGGLCRVKSHVVLELNFGNSGNLSAGPILKSRDLPPGWVGEEPALNDTCVSLRFPKIALVFAPGRRPEQGTVSETQARVFVEQFDADRNGYVERKELPAGNAGLFERIDADGDGRLSSEEVMADFVRQSAGRMSLVHAMVAEVAPPIFENLDTNGDGRLGLREMRDAARNLAVFDKNGDGEISPAEIPRTVLITIVRGLGGPGAPPMRPPAGGKPVARTPPTRRTGPSWFVHMDRNGDGDVSPAEFLGSRAQFDALDTDHDGLINAAEARTPPK
jgi:Ca2+-binding EF-hand superfamily protein